MKIPFHRTNQQSNRWLCQFLVLLLALPPIVAAQSQAPTAPAGQPATIQSLKVVPLAGNGEMNDLQRKVMAPLVVQVLDLESRPVEGADVTFRFPIQGPSAAFADQENSQTVRTNADGQASATGWAANGMVGRFQVQVTASRGNELGTAVVSMTNAVTIANEGKRKRKSLWSSKWTKIGLIAGAAAVVAVVILATRSSGPSTPPTTIVTAVPGFPTIGGAQ
jgi:hypothetical protein